MPHDCYEINNWRGYSNITICQIYLPTNAQVYLPLEQCGNDALLIHCKLRVDQSIRSCIQPRNSQGIINGPRYVFARMNTCTHHVMEKFVYFGNCGSKSRRTPPQDIINPCQETRRKFPLTIIPSFFRKTAKHSGIRLSSKK